MSVEAPRTSLTPEAWIEAATEVLVDEGIDHVRVDALAQRLQVTRGSFYWHFKSRDDLLRRVLASWHEGATDLLTLRLSSGHPDPRVQLRDVLSLPHRGRAATRAARIELAIRAWARRDAAVRHAVDESDASRIGYIAQLFSAIGFPVAEARHRAVLLYSHLLGESLMASQPGAASMRAERAAFVEALLTQPLGQPPDPQPRPRSTPAPAPDRSAGA